MVIGGSILQIRKNWQNLLPSKTKPTFHIETFSDLNIPSIKKFETIGVTAGASTPEFIIREVCERLEKIETESK